MTNRRIQPWRRLTEALQAILILGTPFIKINGESALRFDIQTLRLHVLGTSLWMDEFFIVLIALIFLVFLIIAVTQLFGRIWCGWLCPQTVLIDFTWFLDRSKSKGLGPKVTSYFLTLLVSIVVAASLIWYFVSPYDFIPALTAGSLDQVIWGFWISLTAVIFLNYAFLRHTWCATVCPYAKLQGALFDQSTMVTAFDQRRKDECMDCQACVKICPVNIDIRKGLSAACINCAECIDTCAGKMAKKGKKGLIGYFFGTPGDNARLIRTNVVLTATLALLSLAFFLYLTLNRSRLDITVLPNYDHKVKFTSQDESVNSYTIALENRSNRALDLHISAELHSVMLKVAPEKISLKQGEYRRIPIYVFAAAALQKSEPETVTLAISSTGTDIIKTGRSINFFFKEAE